MPVNYDRDPLSAGGDSGAVTPAVEEDTLNSLPRVAGDTLRWRGGAAVVNHWPRRRTAGPWQSQNRRARGRYKPPTRAGDLPQRR